MASKKYPPGQKPPKVTMAEAYKSAEKTVPKPPSPGSAAANRAAFMSGPKAIVKWFAEGGVSGNSKPKATTVTKTPAIAPANPPKSGRGIIKTLATVDAPTVTATTTTTSSKAKPYTKLKQASRESERRDYVQKQLDRLGIKPTPAGKPRSAAEKAARQKARGTWDKKNKFKKKLPSNTSSAKAEMEAE